jgi:hypothetical protein
MTHPLLVIPNLHPAQGEAPILLEDAYIGYYDAGLRQLVFVFDAEKQLGFLYLSSAGWKNFFIMQDARLPQEILLSGSEAGWALACWRAALIRHGRA